jgi:glycosyltransferase 2 family protein
MLIAFYFIYLNLSKNWAQIVLALGQMNPRHLIGALCLTLLMLLLMPLGWNLTLYILGHPLGFKKSAFIFFRSSILRYLPGSFWQFTGRAALAKESGVPLFIYTKSTFLELSVLLSMCGVFSGMGLVIFFHNSSFFLLSLGFLLLIPIVFWGSTRLSISKWKVSYSGCSLKKQGLLLGLLSLNYLLVWVFFGGGILLLLQSLPGVKPPDLLSTIALNCLSWSVGFISPSPGGLGVRELSLAWLFPQELKTSAIMASFILRLMEMMLEILLLFVSLLKSHRIKK